MVNLQDNPLHNLYGILNHYRRYSSQIHFILNTSDQQLNHFCFYLQFLIHSESYSDFNFNCSGSKDPSSLSDKEFFVKHTIRGTGIRRVYGACQSHRLIKQCSRDFQLIQTASDYFNFTVVFDGEDGNRIFISASITQEAYPEGYRAAGPDRSTFIRDFEDYYLLYCEDELKFHGLDYGYWLMPFDFMTWTFLGISIVFGAIYNLILKFEITFNLLVESILSNIAIVLRQCMNARSASRIEILLCLCTFFLSMDYESIVTSKITVPDPPILANDLHQLILDWGYKVFFPVVKPEDILRFDHHEFRGGFKKYNMTLIFLESIQGFEVIDGNKSLSWGESMGRRNRKIATDIAEHQVEYVLEHWKSLEPDRFCHVAKNPFFRRYYSRLAEGRGFGRIIQFQFFTLQNGIMMWWTDIHKWIDNYINKSKAVRYLARMKTDSSGEKSFAAVKLNEKVLQIFQIWAFIASCSLICFVGELACGLLKRRVNVVHVYDDIATT
jgi:hypothetical protein